MKKHLIIVSILGFILSGCGERTVKSTNQCTCAAQKESAELVMNIPKKTKPEYVSTYKVLFTQCQTETLKEETCIEYSLFQSIADSTEFHLYERWISKQGQTEHTKTDHFKEFIEASKDIFEKPSGQFIETYIYSCCK